MSKTSQSMAHCNVSLPFKKPFEADNPDLLAYGVPPDKKLLTVDLYHRRFDEIRHYLDRLGLTLAEREAILRILRLYAYYGKVYPKAQQIATGSADPLPLSILPFPPKRHNWGCSKRSFWRAIAKLREDGLIQVHNRFLHGRQISNCYRLDKLIVCLVRFLMEHGGSVLGSISRQLRDALVNPQFWRLIPGATINLSAGRVNLKFI